MPPKSSKRKAANGYRLPAPIPAGEVVTGLNKKRWRIGQSIGVGGFGEIYLCSEDVDRAVGEDANLALKIEPHENGPLFVEMNFYIRAAQPQAVQEFKQKRKIASLGMPVHCGSGSHVFGGEKYRFLVMERFGEDLQKLFQTGRKKFPPKASFNIAIKVIDTLEYIHSRGYVHNDIKAQNLLLGRGRSKENDVYLVDFGLVSKYQRDGVHLEYKPDARKAHDGTIEYTSRDAHIGAHSRRSDLEILGYNIVHWMSGTLPWMDNLTSPKYVQTQKQGFMSDVTAFLQRCFGEQDFPAVLEEYLDYVANLDFHTEPDYDKCRNMFGKALKKLKIPLDGKLDFSTPNTSSAKKKRRRKKSETRNALHESSTARRSARRILKTCTLSHLTPAESPTPLQLDADDAVDGMDVRENLYTASAAALTSNMDKWSWERVLCSDPEMLIRQASRQSEPEDENPLAVAHRLVDERRQKESLLNPTPAMRAVMERMEQRERDRQHMTWQQQLQHLTLKRQNGNVSNLKPNLLTPAMEEVIRMRSRKIPVEIDVPITPDPSDSECSDSEDSVSSHEEYVPPGSRNSKRSSASTSSSSSEEEDCIPELRLSARDKQLKTDMDFDYLLASPSRNLEFCSSSKSVSLQVSIQNYLPAPNKIRNKASLGKSETNAKRGKANVVPSPTSSAPSSCFAGGGGRSKSKGKEKFTLTDSGLEFQASAKSRSKKISSISNNELLESTKRASCCEVDVGESFPNSSKRRTRGKANGCSSKKPTGNALETVLKTSEENQTIGKRAYKRTLANVVVVEAPPARRKTRSSSSSTRETRAQDWNWANVLHSYPEKGTRRKSNSRRK